MGPEPFQNLGLVARRLFGVFQAGASLDEEINTRDEALFGRHRSTDSRSRRNAIKFPKLFAQFPGFVGQLCGQLLGQWQVVIRHHNGRPAAFRHIQPGL